MLESSSPHPSENTVHWTIGNVFEGRFEIVELEVYLKDGQAYVRHSDSRVLNGGYADLFSGSLQAEADKARLAGTPAETLSANHLRFVPEGRPSPDLPSFTSRLVLAVDDPAAFCAGKNGATGAAVKKVLAQSMEYNVEWVHIDQCIPLAVGTEVRGRRLLPTQNPAVQIHFTVILPDGTTLEPALHQLAGAQPAALSRQLQMLLPGSTVKVLHLFTPANGNAPPQNTFDPMPLESSPASTGQAIDQGTAAAIFNILGLWSASRSPRPPPVQREQLSAAAGGAFVFGIAAVLLVVLYRHRGRETHHLLIEQPGDE